MNFYRYDELSNSFRNDVKVFQGRKLKIDGTEREVTPDIGILEPSNNGVIGEVKRSFPKDKELWKTTFEQLKKYDNELIGWPNENGKVKLHDVVLLTNNRFSRVVKDYYENEISKTELIIKKLFAIIEFYRTDEAKPFIAFRKEYGKLGNELIDNELYLGKQVPMDVFISIYSKNKLYDAKPPLPYLLNLIWENVVQLKASEDPNFQRLRKNQKLDVNVEVNEIIDILYKGFSFYEFHQHNTLGQPRIPKKEWIVEACEIFVKKEEAKWKDSTKQEMDFFFKKYDDVLEHFIELCLDENTDEEQIELFPSSN
jgi:hypothetical protein